MSDVQPALSREEWEASVYHGDGLEIERDGENLYFTADNGEPTVVLGAGDRLPVAARLLRGYFTWEMVDLLWDFAVDLRRSAHVNDRPNGLSARYADAVTDLHDRIAALLPPREET